MKQDQIFRDFEGNAWFNRNSEKLSHPSRTETDLVQHLLQSYDCFKPTRVLEIGCANGWRLADIHKKYNGVRCVGIEPSGDAIKSGKSSFPFIDFRKGMASNLPIEESETFDLVIVSYVLHWVSRETLFKSVSEIDRAVADGGLLFIGDHLPDGAAKRFYHHLPEEKVYTFKQDYCKIFTTSNLYTQIARLTYNHDNSTYETHAKTGNRGVCCLLRKSYSEFYVEN